MLNYSVAELRIFIFTTIIDKNNISINLAKKNINHLRQTNYLINNNIFIEYNTQPIIHCAKKKQDKILLIIILAL